MTVYGGKLWNCWIHCYNATFDWQICNFLLKVAVHWHLAFWCIKRSMNELTHMHIYFWASHSFVIKLCFSSFFISLKYRTPLSAWSQRTWKFWNGVRQSHFKVRWAVLVSFMTLWPHYRSRSCIQLVRIVHVCHFPQLVTFHVVYILPFL